ncbi:probable cutinase 1 precursor [Fusarium torulosum]|uniref:cutinase n=1 Tax=Fusarium torulosum TaxID=33205 RepID=A0AAE8SNG8_9HYPO|nr:probable cutinase 1 precursor [Fusarium torulosum]
MKFSIAAAFMAATASALPAAQESALEARQLFGGSITRNDLTQGSSSACPSVIFVYARGSTEAGNLGTLGPVVASKLEAKYGKGNVWVQGVGGAYTAGVGENALPRGTTPAAIRQMVGHFEEANTKCPKAVIVAAGYSQGAALAAAATTDVDDAIREKIAGVVLFGYTKNLQNQGKIPSYPEDRTKVFCNAGDLVCTGTLIVAGPHLLYQSAASGGAPEFLIEKADAAGAGAA